MSHESIVTIIEAMLEDVDRFLNEANYSETTSYSYEYHLFRLAKWLQECCIDPAILSASLLNTYLKGQDWADNTKRQAGSAAKAFFKWRYGAKHPALTLKLPKDNAGPGRYLDQSQLEHLLASFDTTRPVGWRNLAMLSLMVESGIRAREVCRLEIDYMNLSTRHFDVIGKGGQWREGTYSDVTACYLDIWLSARKEVVKDGVQHVFVSVNGKTKGRRMTPGGLRAIFRKYGKNVNIIQKLSPHDLRRTMAMLLTEKGAPSRVVQELGAWSDIRMVQRYTRNLKPNQIDQYTPLASQRVNGLFK